MSRAWLLGICTVLLLASCQTEDLKTETEKKTLTQIEPSAGYEIYKQQSCITCHGDN
ncbi:hypothetical protein [Bacillus sp. JCM 19041]|uniref:hypothetical protein n=1 Tax=Bacillus sp. JCM 19041 TaxID=1460637 RepID=UPI000B260180